jgi:hypothetical protein
MKRSLLAILAFAAVLLPTAARAELHSQFGIVLQSCTVNNNNGYTNGVNIVYYNTHPSPATEIDFRIGYRLKGYTVVDRGTFSQNATINHNINNGLVGVPWQGPHPNNCWVNRVVLANGRVLQ